MTTPAYNGATNADDTLVTPWNIAGWTAQAIPLDTIQVTNVNQATAPLPSNLVYAQVNAYYFDFDNNPLSGFLTFQTSEGFTVTSNNVTYRIPQRYTGRDNSALPGGMNNWGSGLIYIRLGLMSVTLMCTQNVAIVTDSGNPLTYHVVEHFLGGQQFDIAISDSAVSPVDLRTLAIPGSFAPYDFDPQNPQGNAGYAPLVPAASSEPVDLVFPADIDGGDP